MVKYEKKKEESDDGHYYFMKSSLFHFNLVSYANFDQLIDIVNIF